MYMDNEGKAVDDVYSGSNYIGSIMENNSDIFFFCKDAFGMCKMSRYIDKKQLVNINGGIKPIINGTGDRNYIDGKYIYLFNRDMGDGTENIINESGTIGIRELFTMTYRTYEYQRGVKVGRE